MNDDIGEEILLACLDDLDLVQNLVERHPQYVNWHEPLHNISMLHALVYNDAHKACRLLLAAGANPNFINKVIIYLLIM